MACFQSDVNISNHSTVPHKMLASDKDVTNHSTEPHKMEVFDRDVTTKILLSITIRWLLMMLPVPFLPCHAIWPHSTVMITSAWNLTPVLPASFHSNLQDGGIWQHRYEYHCTVTHKMTKDTDDTNTTIPQLTNRYKLPCSEKQKLQDKPQFSPSCIIAEVYEKSPTDGNTSKFEWFNNWEQGPLSMTVFEYPLSGLRDTPDQKVCEGDLLYIITKYHQWSLRHGLLFAFYHCNSTWEKEPRACDGGIWHHSTHYFTCTYKANMQRGRNTWRRPHFPLATSS